MAQEVQSVEELQAAAVVTGRPQFIFTVPKKMKSDVHQIALVQVTPAEEIMATKRSKADPYTMAFELAKASFVGVKWREKMGAWEKLNTGDGSVETVLNKMDPKSRQLWMNAYAKIHNADKEDQTDFLASEEILIV